MQEWMLMISAIKIDLKNSEYMQKNKSIDLCGCSMDIIDEHGNVTSEKIQISNPDEILKEDTFQSPILHITFFGKKSFCKT